MTISPKLGRVFFFAKLCTYDLSDLNRIDSPDTDFLPCVKPAVLNDLSADLDSRILLKFIAEEA